jgi:multidrug resistance efflux pump
VTRVWVQEGDPVWAGMMLFQMDDRLARDRLREARADLRAARADLTRAQQARKAHADKVEAQKARIEAVKHQAAAQAKKVSYSKKMHDAKAPGFSLELLRAAEEELKAAEDQVKAEQANLRALEGFDLTPELEKARANIEAKEAAKEKARLALLECAVYAPADGTVLRLFVTPGQTVAADAHVPAVQFCPAVPRIVRAEVQQEWGGRVAVGQHAVLEDNTRAGQQWRGRVQRVSDWYDKRRSKIQEPFQFNDVRTLECLLTIDPGQPRLRIGQRMRVHIKQGGP